MEVCTRVCFCCRRVSFLPNQLAKSDKADKVGKAGLAGKPDEDIGECLLQLHSTNLQLVVRAPSAAVAAQCVQISQTVFI